LQPSEGFNVPSVAAKMRPEFIDYLACPVDHQSPLRLDPIQVGHDGDIQEGTLQCPTCERVFPIRDSIPSFVTQAPKTGDDDEINHWKIQEQELRDLEAAAYDGTVPEPVAIAELKGLTSVLSLASKHTLLDLGCGTGRMTMKFAKLARITVGVDFSLASLRIFEKRIPPEDRGQVHLAHADLFHLPLRNAAFDRAVSNGVFHHLPELLESKKPVLEAARVLMDQGIFAFALYNYSRMRVLLARFVPGLTYGEGFVQEGFHADKIYFRRFRWQEIEELLEGAFEVETIRGMRIVPREILNRGGSVALYLEGALQRSTISRSLGYYVLASGQKRVQT